MTDKSIRDALKAAWVVLKSSACCGGRGLVVGCPICGKRWR